MSITARMPVIAALALIAAALFSASAGAGDRPSCFGHRATIVGTNGDDHHQGTDGDDVIVAGPARTRSTTSTTAPTTSAETAATTTSRPRSPTSPA